MNLKRGRQRGDARTWTEALRRYVGADPAPGDPAPVLAGRLLLGDTPGLISAVSPQVAATLSIPEYAAFLRTLAAEMPARPTKPTEDAIEHRIRERAYPPLKAAVYREYLRRTMADDYFLALKTYEQAEASRKFLVSSFPPNPHGYISFLCKNHGADSGFFWDKYLRLPISERDRERHTYITGGTGMGKTEAIKTILYHYVARNTGTAVVVLDPHGDLAEQVAQWR